MPEFDSKKQAHEIIGRSGSFKINGIFSITKKDPIRKVVTGINYQSGLMLAEAMRFAVERINNDSNYLFGYQLKINKIYDYQEETSIRHSVLQTFLGDIPFLIGPHTSEATYETSILTGTFRQPAISYGATYSDFDPTGAFKQYMLRTVSSDSFRIQAALDMIKTLEWNYVAVVSSYGYNGEREARRFIEKLSGHGICLAEQHNLVKDPKPNDYLEIILSLMSKQRIRAIVLMTTHRDSAAILKAIRRVGATGRYFLVFFYGCTNLVDVVQGNEREALGALSIDFKHTEVKEFKRWFLARNPSNTRSRYFKTFWEHLFNCSLSKSWGGYSKQCDATDKLQVGQGYYPNTAVQTVINAVYAIAKAIRDLIQFYCSGPMGKTNQTTCFIDASDRNLYSHAVFHNLKNLAYKDGSLNISTPWNTLQLQQVRYEILNFALQNGKFINVPVGDWVIRRPDIPMDAAHILRNVTRTIRLNRRAVWWVNGSREIPRALCSEECPVRYIRVRDSNSNKAQCCWNCVECPKNQIAVNETCVPCAETEQLDATMTKCISLPTMYIEIDKHPETAVFIFVSIVGIILVIFVSVTFIYFNGNRIVRASGRDLCYMILVGIALTFLCPFAFLSKPSVTSCIFRGTLPGMAFLVCYAPLFLKTNRIYRIFLNAKTSVTRPILISPQSQLLILGGIVSIQILLAGVWFVSKMPEPAKVVSEDRQYITVHCNGDSSPLLLILNLALSVVFMISCTVLAFKTRHFPKNYNEAKFIGITMYITCVCWAVFLPTYFITPSMNTFLREYLMCSICLLIGMVTLCGLFGQKVKILLLPSQSDMNENRPQMLSSVSHHKSPSHQDLRTNGEFMSSPSQIRVNISSLQNGNVHTESEGVESSSGE